MPREELGNANGKPSLSSATTTTTTRVHARGVQLPGRHMTSSRPWFMRRLVFSSRHKPETGNTRFLFCLPGWLQDVSGKSTKKHLLQQIDDVV